MRLKEITVSFFIKESVSWGEKTGFWDKIRARVSAEKADTMTGQTAINKINAADLQLFMIFNNIITK
jgi:hypothetical protein